MEQQEGSLPIHLAACTFDPLKGKLRIPKRLQFDEQTGEPSYVLLQTTKPLTREERDRLQGQHGLKLTDYVPEFAYIETVRPELSINLTHCFGPPSLITQLLKPHRI